MNNKERKAVLVSVLTKAFDHQFSKFEQIISEEVRKQVPQQFNNFLADEVTREWLMCFSPKPIFLKNGINDDKITVALPRFEDCREFPPKYLSASVWHDQFKPAKIDVVVPKTLREPVIDNIEIYQHYMQLWQSYVEARKELSQLLYSYSSTSKFINDFPEYKQYFPESIAKPKLPVVCVDQVRKNLSSLGIPAPALIKN